MKTIEEKYAAICAELLATVPNFKDRHDYAWMSTENDGNSYSIHVGINSHYFDASKGSTFYNEGFYLLIYAGMGLEAAEAVDSANKEIERLRALLPSAQEARQVIGLANHTIEQLRSSLDSEKARAAKLVEAQKEMAYSAYCAGFSFQKSSGPFPKIGTADTFEEWYAAHKKGEVGA